MHISNAFTLLIVVLLVSICCARNSIYHSSHDIPLVSVDISLFPQSFIGCKTSIEAYWVRPVEPAIKNRLFLY